ncbi:MAG: PPC domain-containing protein [Verrucomicrobiales bacterium]
MRAIQFFLCLLFSLSSLQAFTPVVSRVEPRGGQLGTELEIKFLGDRLHEPQEVIFFQPGLTVKKLEKENEKVTKALIAIAPDAPLGEHLLRLRCKGGVSYLRSFWVGQFPTVDEARDPKSRKDLNNSFEEPQKVELNVTVQGVADNEDADYYRVSCKKGQRLSVEVEGMRLGRSMFDPYIAILNDKRFELAVSDDAVLLKRDACVSIVVPEDGDYTILIRESAYQGNGASQYRAHIGTFPRPTSVFPPGGRPGEKVALKFIGDPAGEISSEFTLPAHNFAAHAQSGELRSPSGNHLRVNDLPYFNEVEPNEGTKEAFPRENAPAAPVAFQGILSKKEDKDWFRFTAKKGQDLRAQVFARELRSPLDSLIIVRNAKDGKALGTNDDATQGSPDSRLDFKIPEDGEYLINIRDQLHRSGENFTYRIEITEKKPALSLSLPYAKRNDSQMDKMICVPRGNRVAIVPNISRQNISCDIDFLAPSLPQGLRATAHPVPKNISNFPLLFEAAADAPIAGGIYHFQIKDPASGLTGPFVETVHHIEINNNGAYHSTEHEKITVAVIEEAPFNIELQAPPVPLVRNGTMDLKVIAHRNEGFDEKITLKMPWLPPGIGAPNSVDIPKGQNEAIITLNAKGDAPLAEWQCVVEARANTPKGPVLLASNYGLVRVAEPYLNVTIELAATQPGQDTNLIAKVEKLQDFTGEAEVILHALPHGVSTDPKKITKDSAEVSFPLKVADDARKGKHANLFCEVIIKENGHPVLHKVGQGGTLRVDPPPPAPKKPAEAKVAKKEEKKPAGDKPLSRLEQLRQAAGN